MIENIFVKFHQNFAQMKKYFRQMLKIFEPDLQNFEYEHILCKWKIIFEKFTENARKLIEKHEEISRTFKIKFFLKF